MTEEQLGVKMENSVPLSEDVLSESLLHLQVKSLLRFRSVSKNWRDLIDSHSFANRHLRHSNEQHMLVKRYIPPQNIDEIHRDGDHIFSFHRPDSPDLLVAPNLSIKSLNNIVDHEHVKLFGLCNDLVCLMHKDINILCNPVLHDFKPLGASSITVPEGHVIRILGCGFGFDSSSDHYKIVQICNVEENAKNYIEDNSYFTCYQDYNSYIRVELYNSGTNSWSLIDAEVPTIYQNPGFDLFFNGACHWQTFEFNEGPPTMGILLSFNMSTEIFQQIEFPDFPEDKVPSLVVLNQCLALVRYTWTGDPHLIDIWVMKEYGNIDSWTKELLIGPYIFRNPLLSWKNEWLLVETNDDTLAYYALHKNEIKTFQFNGLENSFRALILTESLLNKLNQANFDHLEKLLAFRSLCTTLVYRMPYIFNTNIHIHMSQHFALHISVVIQPQPPASI